MCFSIPYKVLSVEDGSVIIEGNKTIKIDRDIKIKKGEYVKIIGNMAVDSLSKKEGLKIRKLIKRLNN